MDMQYQLKAGSYYLYDMREAPSAVTGERRFKLKTDTVAIAFDVHTGEVHQHGSPTRIQSWANNTRRRLRAAGAQDVANDIVVGVRPAARGRAQQMPVGARLCAPHVLAPGHPAPWQAAAASEPFRKAA